MDSSSSSDDGYRDFDSSELGSETYWNQVYERELENYNESKDTGEIWFGKNCQSSVIRWINKCERIKKESPIIDLGCGNGSLLIELAKQGYSSLTGMDYSANAITFSKTIAADENLNSIDFQVGNILDENSCPALTRKYQLCHDKGTYDAISLSPNYPQLRAEYIQMVKNILKEAGLFILTSCNWTRDQLTEHFSKEFCFHEDIQTTTAKFQFGGATGTHHTTLVFVN